MQKKLQILHRTLKMLSQQIPRGTCMTWLIRSWNIQRTFWKIYSAIRWVIILLFIYVKCKEADAASLTNFPFIFSTLSLIEENRYFIGLIMYEILKTFLSLTHISISWLIVDWIYDSLIFDLSIINWNFYRVLIEFPSMIKVINYNFYFINLILGQTEL